MVKNILLSLLFVIAFVGCSDDNSYPTIIKEVPDLPDGYTYIPDIRFEQALIDQGIDKTDTILDNMVKTSHIENITELYVGSLGIYELTGIEDFRSLEILDCGLNQLTELDLSQNQALKKLECKKNKIRFNNLILKNNPLLNDLSCWGNQITSLDLTFAPNLKTLSCMGNLLTQLDLTKNKKLRSVSCDYNQIVRLTLNNPALRTLFCDGNHLQRLDLSQCPLLSQVNCHSNQLSTIHFADNNKIRFLLAGNNNFESIDLSNCSRLIGVDLKENKLKTINICNGNNLNMRTFFVIKNPDLKCIQVDDVAWSTANWTDIDETVTFSQDCGF